MQLSQSVQGSPAVGRHKQETVVRVQGWSGPGSDEQISVAPAWQPQGTPQKESPPLHGGKPWGWADNSNGAHSVSPPGRLRVQSLQQVSAERPQRSQNTGPCSQRDTGEQGDPLSVKIPTSPQSFSLRNARGQRRELSTKDQGAS